MEIRCIVSRCDLIEYCPIRFYRNDILFSVYINDGDFFHHYTFTSKTIEFKRYSDNFVPTVYSTLPKINFESTEMSINDLLLL